MSDLSWLHDLDEELRHQSAVASWVRPAQSITVLEYAAETGASIQTADRRLRQKWKQGLLVRVDWVNPDKGRKEYVYMAPETDTAGVGIVYESQG